MTISLRLFLLLGLAAVVWSSDVDHKALNEKQRSIVMDFLDKDFKPCTSFYQYACFKWSDSHEKTRDNFTTVAAMLNYEANMEVMEYLEKTPQANMPDFVKNFKDFYGSCMEQREFKALTYMHWMEKEDNMKWALLTADNAEDVAVFTWPTTLAMFRKYGFNDIFLKETITYQSSDKFTIALSKPNYGTYNYLNSYHMEEFNTSIPLPPGTMDFMKLWEIIDKFEDKLNDMKFEKEKKIYKFTELPYAWMREYLLALAKPKVPDANMEIVLDNVAYMEAFDRLLKEYDNLFLTRYLEVRFIYHMAMAQKRDTPNECMTTAKSLMPMAFEWIYAELHPELQHEMAKIYQMFENIVKNVNRTLHMDKHGLIPKELFEKLDTIQLKVGNLPQENSKEILQTYFNVLHLSPTEYYGNYLKLLRFHYELEHTYANYGDTNHLRDNKEFFYKTPEYKYDPEIHPEYYAPLNILVLPLALLRPPVYHVDFEDFFKQSSLGSLMGNGIFGSFETLHDRFDDDQLQQLAQVVGVHSAFEVFFSSLQPEDISRYQTMFNLTSLQELKQMFFLNAVHYRCEWYVANADVVDFMATHLSDFAESFDCKMNSFLKMF
uniref:Peptidase family M13 n=1 Tax=Musca domestica TaxID=7370 RepID=T1PBW2_MUSDO